MHFTALVILSLSQHIGSDYHILLSHNCVIMTNERTQCAVFPPQSRFQSRSPALTELSFSPSRGLGKVELARGIGGRAGWQRMDGGADGGGDGRQEKRWCSAAKCSGRMAGKMMDRRRRGMERGRVGEKKERKRTARSSVLAGRVSGCLCCDGWGFACY